MAGFAAIDAGVILAAFDGNDDGILDGDEIEAWGTFVEDSISENKWDALEQAWYAAQGKFLNFMSFPNNQALE